MARERRRRRRAPLLLRLVRRPERATGSRGRKPAGLPLWQRSLALLWDLLPLLALLLIMLTVFVLDPAAVARLAWACMTGAFGTRVQVVVSAVVLLGAGAIAWAFWPQAPAPAPKRRAASGGAVRPRRPKPATETAGAEPPEGEPRRRSQRRAVAPAEAAPITVDDMHQTSASADAPAAPPAAPRKKPRRPARPRTTTASQSRPAAEAVVQPDAAR